MPTHRAGLIALSLLGSAVCATLFGCGPSVPDPTVFAVKGVVTTKNNKPVAKAFVRFLDPANNELIVNGQTDDEGVFTLQTIVTKNNRKLTGAPAGDYDVIIILPMSEVQSGGESVNLPKKLTVRPQDDNDFKIVIDPPRK